MPFFVRAGKCLPVTVTEVQVGLKRPPLSRLSPKESNCVRFRPPTVRPFATSNYAHCGYTHPVKTEAESLLPLPPATFHILVALADEDRHGYAVIKDIEALTAGRLKLSAGTLYRSVDRMVQQGLIREISSPLARNMDDERRRYYRITPFGREVAMAESRRLAQMLDLARAKGLAPRKA